MNIREKKNTQTDTPKNIKQCTKIHNETQESQSPRWILSLNVLNMWVSH
jgi:hypothetical protein